MRELDEPLPLDAVSAGFHVASGPFMHLEEFLECYYDFGPEERVAHQFCKHCRKFWTVDLRPPKDYASHIAESLLSGDIVVILSRDEGNE